VRRRLGDTNHVEKTADLSDVGWQFSSSSSSRRRRRRRSACVSE